MSIHSHSHSHSHEHHGYLYHRKISHIPQHLMDVEVFATCVSYLIYLTLPIHAAMICLGFMHKDECPVDVRIPRFLFFGGLAGFMTVTLRIVLVITWRNLRKKHKEINYDPNNHPGLSMVRTIMYVFILFVVLWNINATTYIFSVMPDYENVESEEYCHKMTFIFAYVLVILFDVLAGILFLFWLAAICAGICNPDFLVIYGYFPSTSEVTFNVKEKIRERKRRKRSQSDLENVPSDEESSPGETVTGKKPVFLSTKVNGNSQSTTSIELTSLKKKLDALSEKQIPSRQLRAQLDSNNDSESSDTDSSYERANLSIVRFAREVNQRRISSDYGNGQTTRLDITNFPSGPLPQQESEGKDRE